MRSLKITHLSIRNFRSFRDVRLALDGRSVFVVGENGGGKTTLLTAIVRALGRDLVFRAEDFADRQLPIEIELTITDLNNVQRSLLGRFADFGTSPPSLPIATRVLWDPDTEQAEVEHYFPRVPGSRSRREQRDALLFQWLPTAREPRRMLEFGVARNLMANLVNALPAEDALTEAIEAVRSASTRLGKATVFAEFLNAARTELASLVPEVEADALTMGIAALTGRDLLRQFELRVQYLGGTVPVGVQSSGVAQLATFAFTILLALKEPGTLLLIDEPELSLHPQAQRALIRTLSRLDGQMVITTHSASLLDRVDPRKVVRLHRSATGSEIAAPANLSDSQAHRLARFTTSQTAEAFFARTVILVEGPSDQLAVEALAERRGRNLDAEAVTVVSMGGVKSIAAFLPLYGPTGLGLKVLGMCDAGEIGEFQRALAAVGMGKDLTRADMENLGFFVCTKDLEDELIRAAGPQAVQALVNENGDGPQFDTFRQQLDHRDRRLDEQLRSFILRHKIEYAPLLVDALQDDNVPEPLSALLANA